MKGATAVFLSVLLMCDCLVGAQESAAQLANPIFLSQTVSPPATGFVHACFSGFGRFELVKKVTATNAVFGKPAVAMGVASVGALLAWGAFAPSVPSMMVLTASSFLLAAVGMFQEDQKPNELTVLLVNKLVEESIQGTYYPDLLSNEKTAAARGARTRDVETLLSKADQLTNDASKIAREFEKVLVTLKRPSVPVEPITLQALLVAQLAEKFKTPHRALVLKAAAERIFSSMSVLTLTPRESAQKAIYVKNVNAALEDDLSVAKLEKVLLEIDARYSDFYWRNKNYERAMHQLGRIFKAGHPEALRYWKGSLGVASHSIPPQIEQFEKDLRKAQAWAHKKQKRLRLGNNLISIAEAARLRAENLEEHWLQIQQHFAYGLMQAMSRSFIREFQQEGRVAVADELEKGEFSRLGEVMEMFYGTFSPSGEMRGNAFRHLHQIWDDAISQFTKNEFPGMSVTVLFLRNLATLVNVSEDRYARAMTVLTKTRDSLNGTESESLDFQQLYEEGLQIPFGPDIFSVVVNQRFLDSVLRFQSRVEHRLASERSAQESRLIKMIDSQQNIFDAIANPLESLGFPIHEIPSLTWESIRSRYKTYKALLNSLLKRTPPESRRFHAIKREIMRLTYSYGALKLFAPRFQHALGANA